MIEIDREKLPYRQTVAAMVTDAEGKFLLVQKQSYQEGQWEFPGGGVLPAESVADAALREAGEELGTNELEVTNVSMVTNQYDWPVSVAQSVLVNTSEAFRGQSQSYALVKFFGNPNRITPQEEEIKAVKWVTREELYKHLVFPNQWQKVQQVLWELTSSGTEIYGLNKGVIETEINVSNPSFQIRKAMVLDPTAMLRLAVWRDDKNPVDRYLEFPLPRVYRSLDQLQKRPPLRVFWEEGLNLPTTRETLAGLLEGFDCWVRITKPGHQMLTKIRLWERYEQGVMAVPNPNSRHFIVPGFDMFNSVKEIAESLEKSTGKRWTGGFTGNIWIAPTENNEDRVSIENPAIQPEGLSLTIPLFDFDTQFSENPKSELKKVITTLKAGGFSGWIANSGRGYHYIGDFLLPHDPGLWKSLGLLASLTLSPKSEYEKHRTFAKRIYRASTLTEAQKIANEILDKNPEKGIPNEDTDTVADMRWIAHCLRRDMTVFRSIPDWRHLDSPRVIARIY